MSDFAKRVSARFRPRAVAASRRVANATALAILMSLAAASSAAAYPNMIRLGYPGCVSCHVSPQGGGVLSLYGKGIDLAQTLRADEPRDGELPDTAVSRFLYDTRLQVSIDRDPKLETEYGFSSSFRTAVGPSEKHRVVYAFGLRSPTLARTRRMGAATMGMSRLYWMYQPQEGLALVVGRDDLPGGLGSGTNSFYRRVNNPNVSSTPTQVKLFWWNERWQVATYGYGPDGLESAPQYEARGVGGLAGLNVWKDRAVVGLTARVSKADAFDRQNASVFARLGLTEQLGLLVEHDVTKRTLNTGRELTHLAGHAEVFYVPVNWLQTALAFEHLRTRGGATTYRLSPSVEVRLTGNLRLDFSTRDVYDDVDSRTYSVGLQVKTQ